MPAVITAAVRAPTWTAMASPTSSSSNARASRAWWTPPNHPVVTTAARVSEEVTGQALQHRVSMPGTVPMYQVCARHRVPATTMGAGRADANLHAPDENIRIEDLVGRDRR